MITYPSQINTDLGPVIYHTSPLHPNMYLEFPASLLHDFKYLEFPYLLIEVYTYLEFLDLLAEESQVPRVSLPLD